MQLSTLSDHSLAASLKSLRATELKATLAILHHLIEFDHRRLYAKEGYPSLFDYCRKVLHYSEGAAFRRIASARRLRDNPEIEGMLLRGEITLCALAAAAKSIEKNETQIQEIAGKSTREVKAIVAPAVSGKPRERVKPIVLRPAPRNVSSAPILSTPELAMPQPIEEERYEIRFSVTKDTYDDIEALKLEFSNALGKDLSVEAILQRLIKEHKAKQQRKVSKHNRLSRKIPVSVKREVHTRDQGQCTHVSGHGERCSAKHFLQIDHIIPFALGGTTEVSNLRLTCPAHNRVYAEEAFGESKIKAKIALKKLPPALKVKSCGKFRPDKGYQRPRKKPSRRDC